MRRWIAVLCAGVVSLTSTSLIPTASAAAPSGGTSASAAATTAWTPTPAGAGRDLPVVYGRCHSAVAVTAPVACVFGDLASPRTVVVVGDSHAANWVPGLIAAATANHWRLVSVTKTTCPAMPVRVTVSPSLTRPLPYTQCATWRSNVMRTIASWRPTVVIVAGSHTSRLIAADGQVYKGDPAAIRARDAAWRTATASLLAVLKARVPRAVVLVAHDTPLARVDVIACVARTGAAAGTACSVTTAAALRPHVRAAELAALPANPRARVIDLTTAICSAGRCAPAARGVLRYRDAGHLTATFSRSLSGTWRAILAATLRPLPAGQVLWPAPVPPPPPPPPTAVPVSHSDAHAPAGDGSVVGTAGDHDDPCPAPLTPVRRRRPPSPRCHGRMRRRAGGGRLPPEG